MKQYNQKTDEQESDIDITPMLDVVFIMLIFFIVTASFVKEKGIGLSHPSPQAQDSNIESTPIVLEIDANNQITIQNRSIDKRAIKSMVVRLRAEKPNSNVLIKVNPQATTAAMVSVMDGVRGANVLHPSVSLSAG